MNVQTTAAKTIARELRRQQVQDLTVQGFTEAEIAARLGVHQSTISRDMTVIKERLRADNDALAESYRDICVKRLQGLYQQLIPDIQQGNVRAITAGNTITMNLAKLTGALVERTEVSGPNGSPLHVDLTTSSLWAQLQLRAASLTAGGTDGAGTPPDPVRRP